MGIDFFSPENSLDDCSVVTGAVSVDYPLQGNGIFTICVNLPTALGPASNKGFFEIYDLGDFATSTDFPSSTGNGTITQLCQDVAYPQVQDEDEPEGVVTLRFLVVPRSSRPPGSTLQFVPIVEGITGEVTENGTTCDCDTDEDYNFNESINLFAQDDYGYNIPAGADLSDLFDPNCNLFTCFRDPATNTNSTSATLLVNGELNVDVDYTIGEAGDNNLSTLTLGPNSRINVLPGVTLNILSTEINGCREMWDAITVQDGGTLNIIDSYVINGDQAITVEDGGELFVDRSNFLNNAVGIFTPQQANTGARPQQQPEISVFGSLFDFEVRNGQGVSSNLYIPEPFLLPPHFSETPRGGAEFNDVETGIIFSNSPGNNTRGNRINEFRNMDNGLIFNRSAGEIDGSLFEDILDNDNEPSGNGVFSAGDPFGFSARTRRQRVNIRDLGTNDDSRVIFTDMENAVRVEGETQITVENTLIERVEHGLFSQFSNEIRFYDNEVSSFGSGLTRMGRGRNGRSFIENNIFDAQTRPGRTEPSSAININDIETPSLTIARDRVTDNDLEMNGAEFGLLGLNTRNVSFWENNITWPGQMYKTFGVALDGGSRPFLKDNDILGNTGQSFTETSGIVLNGVFSPTVSCNAFTLVETGINATGTNQSSRIRGNNFNEGGIGLLLGDTDFGDDDPTTISPQIHQANRWVGPFTGFGAAFFGATQTDLEFSEIIVDPADDPLFTTSQINVTAANSWFDERFNSSVSNYNCPAGSPPNITSPTSPDSLSASIVKGTYDAPGQWEASEWMAYLRLHRAVQAGELNPALYPDYNNWLTTGLAIKTGDYFAVEDVIADITFVSASRAEQLKLEESQIEIQRNKYIAATKLRYHSPGINVDSVNTKRSEYLSMIATLKTDAYVASGNEETEFLNDITAAENLNDNLADGEVYMDNQRVINAAYLDILKNGLANSGDMAKAVLPIAAQCPLDGGEAVYQARAIAALLGNHTTYDDGLICTPANNSLSPGGSSQNYSEAIVLFPNPTSGEFSFKATEDPITGYSVFDTMGRLVLESRKPTPAQGITRVNLPQHIPGTYIIQFKLEGGNVINKLFNIQ